MTDDPAIESDLRAALARVQVSVDDARLAALAPAYAALRGTLARIDAVAYGETEPAHVYRLPRRPEATG
jgi:hypothetical protein